MAINTREEFLQAAQQVVDEFWEKYRPANLLNTDHNASTVLEGVWNFFQHSGGNMPSAKEVRTVVNHLGDLDHGGKLQYHHPAQLIVQQATPPPNPVDNLPHADIKALKSLRSVEDVQRFKARVEKDGLDYMSGFKYLRAGSKPYQELNDRMNFIVQNEIHASDLPEEPTSAGPKRVMLPTPIAAARAAVDAMTVGDVGQTGSSMGRRQLLLNKQKRLHYDINDMWSKGVKPDVIEQRTKEAIKESGSSSIR